MKEYLISNLFKLSFTKVYFFYSIPNNTELWSLIKNLVCDEQIEKRETYADRLKEEYSSFIDMAI